MIKVVVTGPESTGKTTLANDLGKRYQTDVVEEYARTYINELNRPYKEEDILEIALKQTDMDNKMTSVFPDVFIADTDLLTLKIWSNEKYGKCDEWIVEMIDTLTPDLYLVCYPDFPWESDSQRENPEDRDRLFATYITEIEKLNIPYKVLKGSKEDRFKTAIKEIKSI